MSTWFDTQLRRDSHNTTLLDHTKHQLSDNICVKPVSINVFVTSILTDSLLFVNKQRAVFARH